MRTSLKTDLVLYMRVRPVGLRSAIRLYVSFASSFLVELIAPHAFKSTGYMIPGKSRLMVRVGTAFSFVQPQTNSLAILAGLHETKTIDWLKVKSGEVFVDVGAHIGRYSLLAASHAAKVVSIEPEPSNYTILVDNINLNRFANVIPLRVALSDRPGLREFYLASGGDSGTSSLEQDWIWKLDTQINRSSISVVTETLDRVVSTLGLDRIDWLKIDVEGHEIPVLQGSRATLSKTNHLILEVSQGNEVACLDLTSKAGLHLVSKDKGAPPERDGRIRATSNWLLARN